MGQLEFKAFSHSSTSVINGLSKVARETQMLWGFLPSRAIWYSHFLLLTPVTLQGTTKLRRKSKVELGKT